MRVRSFQTLVTAVLCAAAAGPSWAQQPGVTTDPNTLAGLAQMVNWPGVVTSAIVIAGSWLVLRVINNVVDNFGEVFAERRLQLHKIKAFLNFGVYLALALIVILLSFNFSDQTLALLGGAVAFATGFAAKDLVASVVAGFILMLDRPFQVGDRVNFGGQYGDVITVGLRSVRLRTLDDSVVTIPNNMFLTDITTCGNFGALQMQIFVDLHIGMDQDVNLACELLREATVTSRYVYLQNPVDVTVSQVLLGNCVALRLRLKAYVIDTQYEKAFETDVTLRALEVFAERGIQPPAVLHRNTAPLPGA